MTPVITMLAFLQDENAWLRLMIHTQTFSKIKNICFPRVFIYSYAMKSDKQSIDLK